MKKIFPQRANGAVNNLLKGILICVCMSIGLCMLASILLVNGYIKEEYIEHTCIITLLSSSFVASSIVVRRGEEGGVMLTLTISAIYSFILGMAGVLVFNSALSNVSKIMTTIIVGSVASLMLANIKGKGGRRKTIGRYR